MKVLGHRGAKAESLENTLQGFLYAQRLLSQGIDGIEFDVQITLDNQLLLTHDDSLQRLCDRQGRLEQLSANYCQQVFKRQTGHDLLTLADIAPYLAGYAHIELEIKTHQRMDYRRLLARLEQVFVQADLFQLPIVLTSFDEQLLHLLQHHTTLKQVSRGLIVSAMLDEAVLLDKLLRLQAVSLGIYYPLTTATMVRLCHRYDIRVSVWTVNDVDIALYLRELDVDTLITDHPSYMLAQLKSSKSYTKGYA